VNLIQALILGLVEGITEYLPVSSTGHLLIAQRLLDIEQTAQSNGYAIAIQAGAIVAVLESTGSASRPRCAGCGGSAGLRLHCALSRRSCPQRCWACCSTSRSSDTCSASSR
jgi:undecaprenyl-diphosphatase